MLNHQGSTQYTIQNNTTTVRGVTYEPYGKTHLAIGLPTDRRYLHAPNDDQTGLIQLGARYYDPALAQFISPDPLVAPFSPQSLHGYSNSFNNPVTYSDPTGLYPIEGGGEGGYNPPPGYGGYEGAPPPHYDRLPPDRWIPDGPFTGEVGENLATFQVELETLGYIQGMPGVTKVPITEWEYHYWNVAGRVANINATAGNQPTVQQVALAGSLFIPSGWIARGIAAGVRGFKGWQAARAAKVVPNPKPVLKPNGAPDRSSPWYVSHQDADGNIQTVGNLNGVHAEVRIQQMQPGAPMSKPFGWRTLDSSKGTEWVEGTVCAGCQVFPRGLFAPGTRGAPGGPWGD